MKSLIIIFFFVILMFKKNHANYYSYATSNDKNMYKGSKHDQKIWRSKLHNRYT